MNCSTSEYMSKGKINIHKLRNKSVNKTKIQTTIKSEIYKHRNANFEY